MPSARTRLLPLVAATALLVLAGCTPAPAPTHSPTRTAPAPTAHEPSTSPVPTPTTSVVATPVGKSCAQLISADTIYAFNPNFVPLSSWKPSAGTAAAQATAYKGVACRWQNETSNDVIDLSVADLDAATIESLKNQAVDKSTLVPTYDGADEGYFSEGDGTGTAIVFVKSSWIVLTSQQFAEPGDPADLVASVLAALR
ncbi:hypothetical protein [Pseudolysinimonas kribbensis]|uniref:hypothetical protein n=1 Tax=Pseudolysinimonas kribbensis TaxID=433641 RepID=UPI0024E090A6|nr:hypothetical protein [Pseudolysinimonas kribbensis]